MAGFAKYTIHGNL